MMLASRARLNLAAALFFLLLPVALFWRPIITGYSLVPVQAIYENDNLYRPGVNDVRRYPSWRIGSDITYQFYPWNDYTLRSVRRGRIPLWNPYTLGGMPFLGNDQSAVLDITKFPAYLLGLSAKQLPTVSWTLTLFLAGFFTFLFMREMEASSLASMIAGTAFALSGPMVAWIGWPHAVTAMWLPFLLFCIERVIRGGTWRWAGFLGLGLGLQALAGHVELSWFVSVTAALWGVFRLGGYWRSPTLRPVVWHRVKLLAAATAVGLAISAVQILPTVEFLANSDIGGGRGNVGNTPFLYALRYLTWGWSRHDVFTSLQELVLLFYPRFFGHPNGTYWLAGTNHNETAIYIGLLPLALAAASLPSLFRRRDYRGLFWLASAVITVGIFRNFPILRLASYLPVFKLTNIGRIRFIFSFSLAVLAGLGADFLIAERKNRWRSNVLLVGLLGIWLVIIAGSIWLWHSRGWPTVDDPALRRELLRWLLVSVGALAGVGLIAWRPGLARVGGALVVATIGLELLSYGYTLHPAVPERLVLPRTRAIAFLQRHTGNYRLALMPNSGFTMTPNTNMLWRLQEVHGYEPIIVRRYSYLNARLAAAGLDPRHLGLLGAKFLLQDRGARTGKALGLSRVYVDRSIEVYKNPLAVPKALIATRADSARNPEQAADKLLRRRFDARRSVVIEGGSAWAVERKAEARARISRYEPERVEVSANTPAGGFLVLNDVFYPGWRAFVDGKQARIYPANVAFRAVYLSPGKHRVVFRFQPRSFYVGAYLAVAGLAIVITLAIFGGDRRQILPSD